MDPQQIVLNAEKQSEKVLEPEITQLDLRTFGFHKPDTCIKRPNEITIASCGIGIDTAGALLIPGVIKEKVDEYIFADTGTEPIFVYDYLDYLKSLGIKIKVVRSHLGTLYDYYKERQIVPTITSRQCTDKFKIRPIRKYIRKKFGKKVKFNMMIFYDWSEFTRMKMSDVKYCENVFPLIEKRITRAQIKRILKILGYRVPFKSGCFACCFNDAKRWKMLRWYDKKFGTTYYNDSIKLVEESQLRNKELFWKRGNGRCGCY